MYKLIWKKKAFTLVETIIVCSVFAIMVVWIILWINKAFASMNNTRVKVRSTNFAREWVEMVYNIRDTNRRKCSWEKDKTRLYIGSGGAVCDYGITDLFQKWIYILKEWKTSDPDNNYYVYAERLTPDPTPLDSFYKIDWFFDEDSTIRREKSKISFTWTYSFYSGWETAIWNIEDLLKWSWTEFYRILRVYWIYKKNTSNPNAPASESELLWWIPAEMRFCVKIFYSNNWWKHETELCSIMTNFME